MVGPVVEQPFAATAAELEERRLFSDIIGILRSHSISADTIPTLCLVGVQSHGKSSLVEFFVGIPLTLIKEDTGTRCPTKFFLQFDSQARTPHCDIVKVPREVAHLYPDVSVARPINVDYKVLPDALGKVMQQLEEHSTTGFSMDELEVHVTSDLCPNLFFVDLPGIVSPIDPRCTVIGDIVRTYLQMPNVIPIMVVKASEDLATGMLYTFIRDHARPGWKESSLFVATHFDANLPKNGDALTLKLEGHCCDPENPKLKRVLTKYFVSCNPPPIVDRAALMQKKHSELVERIRNLERLEADMIEKCLAEVKSSGQPDFDVAYWRPFMGLSHAKSAIKRKWYESYSAQFPNVQLALMQKQRETAARIAGLHAIKESLNPTAIRLRVSSLAADFLNLIKLVTQQDSTIWSVDKLGSLSSGVSFEDEDARYRSSGGKVFVWGREMSQSDMMTIDASMSGWQRELPAKLLGVSQIRRLFNVNRAIISMAELPPVDDSMWMNALGHFIKASTEPSWDHAIAQVVNWSLREIMIPSVDFLTSRVMHVYNHIGVIVASALKDKYDPEYHRFIDEILESYLSFVAENGERSADAAKHLVRAKSSFLNMVSLGCGCSLAQMFCELEHQTRSTDHVEAAYDESAYYQSPVYDEPSNGEEAPPPPLERRICGTQARLAMLLSEPKSTERLPLARYVDRDAVAIVRDVVEKSLLTQLSFSVYDIESLIVCDLERPIHNPYSRPELTNGDSLEAYVNRVACQDADKLMATVVFDEAKNEADILELEAYSQTLAKDIVLIEEKRDALKALYSRAPRPARKSIVNGGPAPRRNGK